MELLVTTPAVRCDVTQWGNRRIRLRRYFVFTGSIRKPVSAAAAGVILDIACLCTGRRFFRHLGQFVRMLLNRCEDIPAIGTELRILLRRGRAGRMGLQGAADLAARADPGMAVHFLMEEGGTPGVVVRISVRQAANLALRALCTGGDAAEMVLIL